MDERSASGKGEKQACPKVFRALMEYPRPPGELIRFQGDEPMTISVDAAAAALREAMRETVKRYSLWYLLQGVLMVIAGVLAFIYPLLASTALIYLLAWVLIVSGAVQAIGLIGARHVPHYWLISVVIAILIGVLLLRQPESGLLIMTLLLIVFFMVEGLSKVIFALTIRPFPNWGWVLASGLVGVVLGVYLLMNMPVSAEWVLGALLGIQLICEGAALAYLAWQVRSA
jgi:uncharacterized membrane protein HdeD (DUF308 family)